MKLSKHKIKQLLKVKNQSQKRVKKKGKAVRGIIKTMGRKRHLNLRHKTLKTPIVMRSGHMRSGGNMRMRSGGNMHMRSGGNMHMQSGHMQSGGDKDTETFLQEKAILETQLILDLSTFKKNIAMLNLNVFSS